MKRLAWLLFLSPALVLADDIYLKGAGSISGRITEETDAMVMIDNGDGILGVPRSRIDRVVKGRSALDEYEERAKKLGPKDVSGWRNLGRWAAQAGLSTQASQAYQSVLAASPDDKEAREALGFVYLEGRWMTEQESYRARGYVLYDGEWMTPAEAQTAQASAAADQARRDAEQRAIDAEIKAAEADARAKEAQERAQEAEEDARRSSYSYPYWGGGWGYGVTYWPSTTTSRPSAPPRVIKR